MAPLTTMKDLEGLSHHSVWRNGRSPASWKAVSADGETAITHTQHKA
eukprot:SAG25_NODE_10056_length_347_cov_0.834677_1_plen_46_part_01